MSKIIQTPLKTVLRARIHIPIWTRTMHTTSLLRSDKHTADTYSKDVDNTPAADKTVNRLDPDSDCVQKPHEAPSGEWSHAGMETAEYSHVEGEKQPYAPKGGDKGRYGAQRSWTEDKGPETSGKEEGPDGKSSSGRK